MEVYALVGAAGTGKSHRAVLVARDHGISVVIDDGLLIEGGKIRAGRSAKAASTRLAAVRTAVFADPEDARQVREALKALGADRVLILGTSAAMVERICQNLGLPSPTRVIHITEVASEREIRAALRSRQREGKHVIPAPTFEVKRSFSSHLVAPLRLLYRAAGSGDRVVVEKSVIRPTFNSLGRLFIAEDAIRALFVQLLSEADVVASVLRARVSSREEGIVLEADVSLRPLPNQLGRLRAAQLEVKSRLEDMTAVQVLSFDLTGAALALEEGAARWEEAVKSASARGAQGR